MDKFLSGFILFLCSVSLCLCCTYHPIINQENIPGSVPPFAQGYPPNSSAAPTPKPVVPAPTPKPAVPAPTPKPVVPIVVPTPAPIPAPTPTPPPVPPVAAGYPLKCNPSQTTTQPNTFSGFLAYTRFNLLVNGQLIQTPNNVKRVAYTYNAGKFTLAAASTITTTKGADGIVAISDGSLVIGGEGSTWKVDPKTGATHYAVIDPRVSSDHVTYDSQRNVIWTSGDNPTTSLVEIPVNGFNNNNSGTFVQLKGDDTTVSAIAFDRSHTAYYTNSSINGNGSFGIVNLDTFTTTRKVVNIPAAHGITYDPFTNTLILDGANQITQIDASTLSVVSTWTAPAQYSGMRLDQDAVDGQGHLWAASNDGNLVFIDFSQTRKIEAPTNYVSIQQLDTNLDDITLQCD